MTLMQPDPDSSYSRWLDFLQCERALEDRVYRTALTCDSLCLTHVTHSIQVYTKRTHVSKPVDIKTLQPIRHISPSWLSVFMLSMFQELIIWPKYSYMHSSHVAPSASKAVSEAVDSSIFGQNYKHLGTLSAYGWAAEKGLAAGIPFYDSDVCSTTTCVAIGILADCGPFISEEVCCTPDFMVYWSSVVHRTGVCFMESRSTSFSCRLLLKLGIRWTSLELFFLVPS